MWPHTRIAWWDVKRWLAMRARPVAAAVALTTLAGGGLAAHHSYGLRPAGPGLPTPPAPAEAPAVEPTIPWSAPGSPSAPGPSTTTPTFLSPTQPWPGSAP